MRRRPGEIDIDRLLEESRAREAEQHMAPPMRRASVFSWSRGTSARVEKRAQRDKQQRRARPATGFLPTPLPLPPKPAEPVDPDAFFWCSPLDCTLTFRACLARRTAARAGGIKDRPLKTTVKFCGACRLGERNESLVYLRKDRKP